MNNRPELTVGRSRKGNWWIKGLPGPDVKYAGPYDTRKEADDDRRGMDRFFRMIEKTGDKRCR